MNNKAKIKIASLVITLLIVIISVFAIWYTYKTITPGNNKSDTAKSQVEVKKDVYEKVTSPEKFGTDISTGEEGYGRANPFAPYK